MTSRLAQAAETLDGYVKRRRPHSSKNPGAQMAVPLGVIREVVAAMKERCQGE